MEIKIFGEHLPVTESIGQYIKNKISHISIPEKILHLEFRIGKEKNNQYVKFYTVCPNQGVINLKADNTNLYLAIDTLMEKIQRNFVKNKELHNIHLQKTT